MNKNQIVLFLFSVFPQDKGFSSFMSNSAASADAGGEVGAAGVPLTSIQKRLRSLTPEQKEASRRRTSLVAKELERRNGGSQHAAPVIPSPRRIDRPLAAYRNGFNVKGWRVRAYNTVAKQWELGEIKHVAKQKPLGQGDNPNASFYVIAIVKHDNENLNDCAYELSCLERVVGE